MSKRQKKVRCPTDVRATRLTSTAGVSNRDKFDEVLRLFDRVAALKNRMADFGHENLRELFADAYAFKARYKEFGSDDLNACHAVDRANRATQEVFRYVHCHYVAPADPTAARNVEQRVRGVLGPLLHDRDVYGRARPKKMRREVIRDLVRRQPSSAGGFTVLSTPATPTKPRASS